MQTLWVSDQHPNQPQHPGVTPGRRRVAESGAGAASSPERPQRKVVQSSSAEVGHSASPPQQPVVPPVLNQPRPQDFPDRAAEGATPSPGRRARSRQTTTTAKKSKLRWLRPKLRWFFLYLPMLCLLLLGGVGFWAWSTVNGLYRVDLGDSLAPEGGDFVNYLIVGSDSRDGIDPNAPDVGVIGVDVKGRRSDTIIVLRVGPESAQMMSIPRDLWVTNSETGKKGRINGAYNGGPANLVKTVTANLGIPINRYLEVDFVSFAGMVDAMGGIDIDFPHPVIDPSSGLKIGTAGVNRLDGAQALAYVRSRHYTELIDGTPTQDPRADIGRQERQQKFIRTVLSGLGATRNPIKLARIAGAATEGVRVDQELGLSDLFSLARRLSGSTPETVVLPTRGANKGGASVLELEMPQALEAVQRFGATG